MTVVARRTVSTPVRGASETWTIITNLLAPSDSDGKRELARIAGVACSLISSEAPAGTRSWCGATAHGCGSIAYSERMPLLVTTKPNRRWLLARPTATGRCRYRVRRRTWLGYRKSSRFNRNGSQPGSSVMLCRTTNPQPNRKPPML